MTKQELQDMVGGRFFHVTFVKKDGTVRQMNARLGVKKYLKDMPQGEGEDTEIDEPDMASNDKMEDEDVDALFMERM